MFGRGYWTPDEPREADIAWRMSIQEDRALPQMGDARFLEKPPLTYWLAGAAIRTFGDTPQAARLPNLVFALIATVAVWLLASSMMRAAAACLSTIMAGSALTAFQVSVWLAPDAFLVAGCAMALLGLYRGYTATSSRGKALWYTLMHIGALIGFMSKSAPGWIVPGLTMLCLVIWERRWRELTRWQLWAGLPLQLLLIGVWVHTVWKLPDGSGALAVLFWNNDVGRFVNLHAAGPLDYAAGHPNWPGKYFLALPYHLYPWTALVIAALCRAWVAARSDAASPTPWRFAICAAVPFVGLLSLATTARGIYIAPALIGFAIAAGLWVETLASDTTRTDRLAVRITRIATGCAAALMALALLAMALALGGPADAAAAIACVLAALAVAGVAGVALKRSLSEQREGRLTGSLAWICVVHVATIVFGAAVLFPVLSRWQDLPVVARAVSRDTQGRPLALLLPDETAIAMLDHGLRIRSESIGTDEAHARKATICWLRAHAADGLVLIKLPGSGPGPFTPILSLLHRKSAPRDGLLEKLESDGGFRVVNRYELPHGRRYALVAIADGAGASGPNDLSCS